MSQHLLCLAVTSALVTACWGQAPWTPWQTLLMWLSIKTGSCEVLVTLKLDLSAITFPCVFMYLERFVYHFVIVYCLLVTELLAQFAPHSQCKKIMKLFLIGF